ncbi:MAG: UDP-N-acetylmuramate dehydrogenase [Deltaproteobacteria bacterium]|nr:UDP-N-acetylmuramate dehydrogenase [Deltaproteobacteria bacterium]
MIPPNARIDLEAAAALAILEDVPLALHTSFRIGGPAALFAEVTDVPKLSRLLTAVRSMGIDTLVLGGGTNVLASDEGFPGLVMRLAIGGLAIDAASGRVRVGAGASSADLVERTIAASLKGLEFAAGLPGTVGGAVAGNAGCYGGSFGEHVVSATIVEPDGSVVELADAEAFGFRYRGSGLGDRGAVLAEAVLALEPGDRTELEEIAARHVATREERHPPRILPCAGSYFKNLPPAEPGGQRIAAGALLDAVGVKELRVGDAGVFERHANIVVNRGRATARDVLTLTTEMARRVKERFGVELSPEVRFVGRRPSI